jgi:hypothetical protein
VAKSSKGLTRELHGTFAQHAITLSDLNDRGAGIFVMVNEGDCRGRKAENVTGVRALFADFDGAPISSLDDIEHKPHILVESSPDRWHAYWLADNLPLAQFGPLQAAIARRFGSDGKVKDLPRVMRLPGFLHLKGPPFLARIRDVQTNEPYSAHELSAMFPIDHAAPPSIVSPGKILEGQRNDTLFNLALNFKRQGLSDRALTARIQKVNAKDCVTPLSVDEVTSICASASSLGSTGYTYFPHALSDSDAFQKLPAPAVPILLAFFRKYSGKNNGKLAVTWDEFEGRHTMRAKKTFHAHLKRIVKAGFLIQTGKPVNTQSGRLPATYAIPEQYLPSGRKVTSLPLAQGDLNTPL